MKKALSFFVFCSLALALLMPRTAPAADTGLYITPKFIYSHTVMDQLKLSTELAGVSHSTGAWKGDDAFGGALAVGYNFDTLLHLPLRAEIEYGIYSQIKGSHSGATGTPEFSGGNYVYVDYYGAEQTLNIQTLFLNAYFDIKTSTPFTPYVGAGIGLAFVNSKTSASYDFDFTPMPHKYFEGDTSSKHTTNFAWNVGAGVGWKIAEPLTLDLGYRFVSLGEAASNKWSDVIGQVPVHIDSKTEHLYMHQIVLGLRFQF